MHVFARLAPILNAQSVLIKKKQKTILQRSLSRKFINSALLVGEKDFLLLSGPPPSLSHPEKERPTTMAKKNCLARSTKKVESFLPRKDRQREREMRELLCVLLALKEREKGTSSGSMVGWLVASPPPPPPPLPPPLFHDRFLFLFCLAFSLVLPLWNDLGAQQ